MHKTDIFSLHINRTSLTQPVSVFIQVSDCHVAFIRDSKYWREQITWAEKKKQNAQNNLQPPYFWQLTAFAFRASMAVVRPHAWHLVLMLFVAASLKGQSCQSSGLFNGCLSCMSFCHSCACWQSQWAAYQLPPCTLVWDLLRQSFLTSHVCGVFFPPSSEAGDWLVILDGPCTLERPRASASLWRKFPHWPTWHRFCQTRS